MTDLPSTIARRPDMMPEPAAAWLDALNPAQRAAVETVDGPVLVLAGAGTGKTRVLTSRLAYILLTRRAWPGQILAVTFSNKAAREMRDRVAAMIGAAVEGLWLGTFHAIAARILRRHGELVGLRSNFTILDTDDQIRLMKQVLQAEGIDDRRWPARLVLGVVERWKDRGLTPDKVPAEEAASDVAGGRLAAIYALYQDRLRTVNAVDFGDLLLHNLTIFLTDHSVLEEYQRRFRYVLVDEYQDTNVAQYLWLRLLAQGHRNLCCVGDDDQSIYGWRGAEIGNILRFEADFPGARIVRLEQNYRSTPPILAAASGLIAKNRGRLGKTLWTEAGGGDPVRVHGLWDGEAEARWVGDEIEARQRQGDALSQIAILVRAGFQTREFEERLLTLGVPYRVVGGPRFYERQEIRDALAYLRLVHQPDDDLAFERIVNLPRRGLGDATLRLLHGRARADGLSLSAAAVRLVAGDGLKPAARKALAGFLDDLDRWRRMVDAVMHTDLARTILDESGYTRMWQADRSPEAPGRLENLKELVVAMGEFETLAGFLEHVALVMENVEGAAGEVVNLMTLHAAKGLEFDTVFLPGWEEGLFPHPRALEEKGEAGLEEERRLAYVGLTRARRRALVSFAANRRIYNQWTAAIPSRFVDELPKDAVEMSADQGLYGAAGMAAAGEPRWSYAAETPRGGFATPRARPPVIEGKSLAVPPRPAPTVPFAVGERVFHVKFGYGTVTRVEGDRLSISFEKAGDKQVIHSYVERA
ncbi:MAG: UvrD-helicase domain-containing protein [Alphaproteobacteria bacterium]|nr:UvrD-helicase domain-containing protein [Alphaproteobacteria bacterium]